MEEKPEKEPKPIPIIPLISRKLPDNEILCAFNIWQGKSKKYFQYIEKSIYEIGEIANYQSDLMQADQVYATATGSSKKVARITAIRIGLEKLWKERTKKGELLPQDYETMQRDDTEDEIELKQEPIQPLSNFVPIFLNVYQKKLNPSQLVHALCDKYPIVLRAEYVDRSIGYDSWYECHLYVNEEMLFVASDRSKKKGYNQAVERALEVLIGTREQGDVPVNTTGEQLEQILARPADHVVLERK